MASEDQAGQRLSDQRRDKLRHWRQQSIAYPNDIGALTPISEINESHCAASRKELSDSQPRFFTVAGRMMNRRGNFLVIEDHSWPDSVAEDCRIESDRIERAKTANQLQLYVNRREEGFDSADFDHIDNWDRGDLICATGQLQRSGKGDLYLSLVAEPQKPRLLVKCLHPMPEKYHGLRNRETRYRMRYLDLLCNRDSRLLFRARSAIINLLRGFMTAEGFMEVETPMLQMLPGGASASPFITHHNALDRKMYLRIAPELYLKRLLVGGMGAVFELNRCFRNEGLSTGHNPEFTLLEFYRPYSDATELMELIENLLGQLTRDRNLQLLLAVQPESGVELGRIERRSFISQILHHCSGLAQQLSAEDLDKALEQEYRGLFETGQDNSDRSPTLKTLSDYCSKQQVETAGGCASQLLKLFEKNVEDRLLEPVFITDYPTAVSPLARSYSDRPWLCQRFELFVGGRELANGFSELNDPEDQVRRFKLQAAQRGEGDDEAMHYDEDFVRALEYGMPPAAGAGIGIDRLVMQLTGETAIRDVLLFPHMRERD